MVRPLNESVVVVTGASSGIGRASALAFARQGATLVLAARNMKGLAEVERECQRLGARAIAVPTDVAREDDVLVLAGRATKAFGRIDVWLNNAGILLFGRVEDTPAEEYERVIQVNLFGAIYGARAAVPIFREQGEGILINVSSVAGLMGQPYSSAYCASKFGLRGFSEALRQELSDAPGIEVCTIFPASIDTPLWQHAANYTGRAVKPIEPVYQVDEVVDTILDLARYPRREAVVGTSGKVMAAIHAVAGGMAERMMNRKMETDGFQEMDAPPSSGNLYSPSVPSLVSGGWRQTPSGKRKTTAAIAGLAVAAIPLGLLAWRQAQRARSPAL